MRVLSAIVLPLALAAQYPPGQYPPNQYPPGQYPPNQYPADTYPGPMGIPVQIPGIHLPSRKAKNDENSKVKTESIEGSLRRLAEKDLLLESGSGNVLRFRLIPKTEFRGKDGKAMRDSLLHPGDRLRIEVNPDDLETAVHVILVRAGSDSEREAASVPVDGAKIGPPQDADFGRGAATRTEATAPKIEEPRAPETAAPRDDSIDAIIADAREAAASFNADLPNFIVQQVTTRYSGTRKSEKWRTMDVVTADVASVNGKEDYRNIKVNGKPTDRPEDTGTWSTGEFQLTLKDVLSPRTDATFTRRGDDRLRNRDAWVFDLKVDQPHSHWTIVDDRDRRIKPAYRGTIWIDKDTRRVLRIEQEAVDMPNDFAYATNVSALEYAYVTIEGHSYLLPANSVNEACGRGMNNCTRNVIQFRNYQKFSSDSSVTFQ